MRVKELTQKFVNFINQAQFDKYRPKIKTKMAKCKLVAIFATTTTTNRPAIFSLL